MDSVTHGLVGYIITESDLKRDTGKWGVIAGISASLLPDADLLIGIFQGTEFSIKYHRYLFNSIFLILPLGLIIAAILVKVSGLRKFYSFLRISLVALIVHTLLDVLTSYGTMVFSPFSQERFHWDWLFIVDPYLSAILLFPLVAIWITKRKARVIARISLASALLYIGLCAGNHWRALSLARDFAQQEQLNAEAIAAIPQPLSPFLWANYILTDDVIYESRVNFLGSRVRSAPSKGSLLGTFLARYRPVNELTYRIHERYDPSPWVGRALQLEGVKTFLWFARFPVARYKGMVDNTHRVWFYDLRFDAIEGRNPFLFVVVFDQKGDLVRQGFQSRWRTSETPTLKGTAG